MKAILVIDINDDYLEDYENFYVDYDLRAERKNENYNESIRYVEECLLKPIPKEKEDLYYPCNEYEQAFNEGYNACLDEILGEKE